MVTPEQFLKPEVIRQIKRLDLRAQFIVRGFLHGLHASPLHGFSVEFSEHRKYTPGDDPKDIDWLVYAKTDKFYVRKFEAERNITGYLVVDASGSMGYTYRQRMTKFEYAICLAAALSYLMINQQDPVGLFVFGDRIRRSLPPKSKRTHFGDILAVLSKCEPAGVTALPQVLAQLAALIRRASLIILLSDLLCPAEELLEGLHRLRHRGHDLIVFHILDEAEVAFPFERPVELVDPETTERVAVDALGLRQIYLQELEGFCERLRRECSRARIDYVRIDTSVQFDKPLVEYLANRAARF
jgi:uncharacterized protein (DUF58 family)